MRCGVDGGTHDGASRNPAIKCQPLYLSDSVAADGNLSSLTYLNAPLPFQNVAGNLLVLFFVCCSVAMLVRQNMSV